MERLSKAQIIARIEEDVRRVLESAVLILEIKSGDIAEYWNPSPNINVIAVIGQAEVLLNPAMGLEMPVQRAVLCEIGLWRSRPYHKSYGHNPFGESGRKFVSRRRKWFALTKEQYLTVAPLIFRHLQKLTNETIANWQCNTDQPFTRRVEKYFHISVKENGRRTLTKISQFQSVPRGRRFSVSFLDRDFLADIHWAALECDFAKKRLRRLAITIAYTLKGYKGISSNNFWRLKGFRDIHKIIQIDSELSVPDYLLVKMLTYLPGGQKYRFYHQVAEIVKKVTDWNGKETKEEQLARSSYPDAHSRLRGIDLWIVNLKKRSRVRNLSQDYVCFEILANHPSQFTNPTDSIEHPT